MPKNVLGLVRQAYIFEGNNLMLPYQFAWYILERVLYIHMNGYISLPILKSFSQDFTQQLNATPIPQHLIVNLRDYTGIHPNIFDVIHVATYLRHPNIGTVIVISKDGSGRRVILRLAQFGGGILIKRIHFVYSRKAAERLLFGLHPDLDPHAVIFDWADFEELSASV